MTRFSAPLSINEWCFLPDAQVQQARNLLALASQILQAKGGLRLALVPARTHIDQRALDRLSLPGQAARILLSYAEEHHCDLIVLGHAGSSGLWGRLLGHTADRMSEHATCDVLIVRRKPPHP